MPRAALRWIERARRFAPDDLTLRFALGIAWLRLGDRRPRRAAAGGGGAGAATCARPGSRWPRRGPAWARPGRPRRRCRRCCRATCCPTMPACPDWPTASPARPAIRAGAAAGATAASPPSADGAVEPPRWTGAAWPGAASPTPPAAGHSGAVRRRPGAAGQPARSGRLRAASRASSRLRDGGLEGWAWHPADPQTPPRLTIRTASGAHACWRSPPRTPTCRRRARWPGRAASPCPPRASPPPAACCMSPARTGATSRAARSTRRWRLLPADRRAAGRARPPPGRDPGRAVAVVVPVHGGTAADAGLPGLGARHRPARHRGGGGGRCQPRAGTGPARSTRWRRQRRIVLLRHARNRGFPASANAGLRAALARPGGPDAVLLNSDTLVPPGWLEAAARRRARRTRHRHRHAVVQRRQHRQLSRARPAQPGPRCRRAAPPGRARRPGRPRAAWWTSPPRSGSACTSAANASTPPGCSARTPSPRAMARRTISACAPASWAGGTWRCRACSSPMSAAPRSAARARSCWRATSAVLERLHPGYRALVAAHVRADPLADARRRLDAARFRAEARARRARGAAGDA